MAHNARLAGNQPYYHTEIGAPHSLKDVAQYVPQPGPRMPPEQRHVQPRGPYSYDPARRPAYDPGMAGYMPQSRQTPDRYAGQQFSRPAARPGDGAPPHYRIMTNGGVPSAPRRPVGQPQGRRIASAEKGVPAMHGPEHADPYRNEHGQPYLHDFARYQYNHRQLPPQQSHSRTGYYDDYPGDYDYAPPHIPYTAPARSNSTPPEIARNPHDVPPYHEVSVSSRTASPQSFAHQIPSRHPTPSKHSPPPSPLKPSAQWAAEQNTYAQLVAQPTPRPAILSTEIVNELLDGYYSEESSATPVDSQDGRLANKVQSVSIASDVSHQHSRDDIQSTRSSESCNKQPQQSKHWSPDRASQSQQASPTKPLSHIAIDSSEAPYSTSHSRHATPEERRSPEIAQDANYAWSSTPDGSQSRLTPDTTRPWPHPDSGYSRPAPDGAHTRSAPNAGVPRPAPDANYSRPAPSVGYYRPAPDASYPRPIPDLGYSRSPPETGIPRADAGHNLRNGRDRGYHRPDVGYPRHDAGQSMRNTPDSGQSRPAPNAAHARLSPDGGYPQTGPDMGYARLTPNDGLPRPVPEMEHARSTPDGGVSRLAPSKEHARRTPDGMYPRTAPGAGYPYQAKPYTENRHRGEPEGEYPRQNSYPPRAAPQANFTAPNSAPMYHHDGGSAGRFADKDRMPLSIIPPGSVPSDLRPSSDNANSENQAQTVRNPATRHRQYDPSTSSLPSDANVSSFRPINGQQQFDPNKTEPSKELTMADLDAARVYATHQPGNAKLQYELAETLLKATKCVTPPTLLPHEKTRAHEEWVAEAIRILKKLTAKPSPLPEALFLLAQCYGDGSFKTGTDHERAFELYVNSSRLGHAESTYRAAVCCEIGAGTRKDIQRALQLYRNGADLGHPASLYKLSIISLKGLLGQPKNIKEAVRLLHMAAEKADAENPHALHELAQLYESEDPAGATEGGIPKDYAQAKELYLRAAHLGFASSQRRLGCAYEYGNLDCLIEPRRSIAWYSKAAESEDPESELALSGWYLTGAEGVLQQSDKEAFLWAQKAADKGLAKAEYALAYYYEMGIGTAANVVLAKEWYVRAAEQGQTRAMARLAELKKQPGQRQQMTAPPPAQQASGHSAAHERKQDRKKGKKDTDCVVM